MRRVIGKTQVREPADGGAGGRSRAIGSEDCRLQLPSVSPAWGEEKPREQITPPLACFCHGGCMLWGQ